jgi:hypothetical protein
MPLLDHFHPPLSSGRHWESFHAKWANTISDALNVSLLPPGYFSEIQVHVGSRVEVDVGTFVGVHPAPSAVAGDSGGGTATITAPVEVWAPPGPQMVMPAFFPDSVQVLVYNTEGGYTLVAAVELVSPGNKDRQEARSSFAAKCVAYLREGVGLITLDIVTSRRANLHNELISLLGAGRQFLLPDEHLRAAAYRPTRREVSRDQPLVEQIEVWHSDLAVGEGLPTLPLGLDKGIMIPLDLEATYTDARQRSRLG